MPPTLINSRLQGFIASNSYPSFTSAEVQLPSETQRGKQSAMQAEKARQQACGFIEAVGSKISLYMVLCVQPDLYYSSLRVLMPHLLSLHHGFPLVRYFAVFAHGTASLHRILRSRSQHILLLQSCRGHSMTLYSRSTIIYGTSRSTRTGSETTGLLDLQPPLQTK